MFFKKPKLNSINELDDYWRSRHFSIRGKLVNKIIKLEQRIKVIQFEISKLNTRIREKTNYEFRPISRKIAEKLGELTNTTPRFVSEGSDGLGLSVALEVEGVAKYRVYLYASLGVQMHTWEYSSEKEYEIEYHRVNASFVEYNGKTHHTFSDYNTDEKVLCFLEKFCRVSHLN